jgi:hypothetical protein
MYTPAIVSCVPYRVMSSSLFMSLPTSIQVVAAAPRFLTLCVALRIAAFPTYAQR